MQLSATFAPSADTPAHIALAEELGFARAWVYDSPALYADPWMVLALAAQRTSRIGLGPGVLVPDLRHVVVTASAVLTLEALAPGRVAVGVGAGFTGRLPLGMPTAMPWRDVRDYVATLRDLLAGRDAALDGRTYGLLQGAWHGPARPVDVPVLLAADGPKGRAVAEELADGVFLTRGGLERTGPEPRWTTLLEFLLVLGDGEAATDDDVLEVMGWAPAMIYHSAYERGAVEQLPGGDRWRAAVEEVPAHRRHLAVHEGHMVTLNPLDRRVPADALRGMLARTATVGGADVVAGRLRTLADLGVDEVAVHIPATRAETALRRLAEAAVGVVDAPAELHTARQHVS